MKTTQHSREPPKPAKQQKHLTLNFNNMKTKHFFTALLALLSLNTFAQLDKKTWLVGGNASFKSYKKDDTFTIQYNNENVKIRRDIREFEINPKIGYFIIDKLALGINTSFVSEKSESTTIYGNASGGSSKSNSFYMGPFVRYYFLKKDKNYNILTEVNCQFGGLSYVPHTDAKGKTTKISFYAGPEIFFNSSVGMEFLVGYNIDNQKMDNSSYSSFTKEGVNIAIGFQIHLFKE